jgi:hypothetical protein
MIFLNLFDGGIEMKATFFLILLITGFGFTDVLFDFQWFTDPPPPLVYFSEPSVTKVSQKINIEAELRVITVYATPGEPYIRANVGFNKGSSQIWSGYLYHNPSDPSPDSYTAAVFPTCYVDGETWLSIINLTESCQAKTDTDGGHTDINWIYSKVKGWYEYTPNDFAICITCYGTNPASGVEPFSLSLIKATYK